MTLSIIACVIGIAAACFLVLRGRVTFEWSRMRSRLLKEAREAGLDGAWEGPSLTYAAGSLIYTARNLVLVAKRGDHTITISPMSLGWRREDPPYTWWWIDLKPLAPDQRFWFYVEKRREGRYIHPKRRDHSTGDPAFDDALCVYTFERDEPEADQRQIAAVHRVLARSEARDILRSIIVGDTDSVSLSSWSLRISRRREGMPIADALAQIDVAVRLAHVVEDAFTDRLYR